MTHPKSTNDIAREICEAHGLYGPRGEHHIMIVADITAALDRERAKCQEYEEALEFYADENNWDEVSGEDCYIPNAFKAGKNNNGWDRASETLKKWREKK